MNNILSKNYSKLLLNRLIKWSEKHETLIDNQYGFQKHKPTIDCNFILHAPTSRSLANSQKLYVAFLDWEKMFDKIDRFTLWRKLLNSKVSSNFILALKSMYNTGTSSIRYENLKSGPIHSFVGVKQDDPASSLLCLFYLNDILENVNSRLDGIINIEVINIFLLLFADDAALFAHDPESLQSLLKDIETYSNVAKIKIILNYSSKVWGTHVAPEIELFQTRFCRKILKVKQATNRDENWDESQCTSIESKY